MRVLVPYVSLLLWITWLLPWPAIADQIILNTGERFTSDKIWEENGKVRFNMHGLVVSVEKADVVAVIRAAGSSQALSRPQAKRAPKVKANEARPPSPPAAQKHAQKVLPSKARAHQQRLQAQKTPPPTQAQVKPKVRGIGFDGIDWQMRPSQIPGIEKYNTDSAYGGIDQYWRPEGSLKLGNVILDGLVFGFWQNRLYTITIWVEGRPSYEKLREVVMDRYGEGKKNPKGLERYIWLEKSTDRMLEFDTTSNTGILWMRSRELETYVKRRYPE